MRRKPNDLKLAALRQTPGLERCAERELRELGRVSDELALPAGTTLCREGAPGGQTWVLLEGRVEVRRFGVLLWEAAPGSLIGDLRVLGALPASVTAKAIGDVRVLLLEPRAAETLLGCPDLARWALADLQRQLRQIIGAATEPTMTTASRPAPARQDAGPADPAPRVAVLAGQSSPA